MYPTHAAIRPSRARVCDIEVEIRSPGAVYFSRDFLVDGFSRFSCVLGELSSTGRNRQISSLIFTKARLNS